MNTACPSSFPPPGPGRPRAHYAIKPLLSACDPGGGALSAALPTTRAGAALDGRRVSGEARAVLNLCPEPALRGSGHVIHRDVEDDSRFQQLVHSLRPAEPPVDCAGRISAGPQIANAVK